nr:hypothetical protein [Tanacetum cinerariifolium]
DEEAANVDVHFYRSMIGSLMYLTSSRPDIMYAVCACSKFQVTLKTSHLQVVKRMFRKSTTGGCQFLGRRLISWQCKKQIIVATSYTEAEKSTTGGCQFLGRRLISWQCKKQTIVATSSTEAEYVPLQAAVDKDAYEKKLIQVLKIHTNDNVVDLLTKAFDVSRFKFLMGCDCYGDYLGFILFFGMKIEGYKWKSTTGGCQFLGRRLISWQCKKQIIVATSYTEAEYVAAASCCGQVLWI